MDKTLKYGWVLQFGVCALLVLGCSESVGLEEEAAGNGAGKADRLGIEGLHAPEGPTSNAPRIVGGERTSGFPAVVALLDDAGLQFCTGTLIGPRTVLTAAHCTEAGIPIEEVYFGSGAELGRSADPDFVDKVGVTRARAHPDFRYDAVQDKIYEDYAVLELEREPSNVEPMAINNAKFKDSMLGALLTLVGFGNTDGWGTGGGKKRVTQTELDSYTDETLYWADSDHNTCHGDSGGPAFLDVNGTLVQVGITSYGDLECAEDGVDMRVDDGLFFIEWAMEQVGEAPIFVDASVVVGPGEAPTEPSEPEASCAGTSYDDAGVCRHANGTFARAACCELQCFEAYVDDAGRCRRGDGKFAPATCCE